MSFKQEQLQKELHKLILTPSTNINDFPTDITDSLLTSYKSRSEGFKLFIQTNLVAKLLHGDVKSVAAALYDSNTDGVVTVKEELNVDGKEYVVIVTLVYIKI